LKKEIYNWSNGYDGSSSEEEEEEESANNNRKEMPEEGSEHLWDAEEYEAQW
jgi:hypothetical protein